MGGVVVISMHENSRACYVVDERHHVYRHAGAFPSQLQLLLVFVAEDILEGAENDLRRMFQLAARRHYQVAMPDQTTVTSNENIGTLNVIGSLSGTKGDIGRCDAVSSGLRVSLLTSRLAATDHAAARGRREGCSRSAGSAPRRTPFCPIKLTLPTHSINILPRLRKTMQVTVNPAVVAQRAYDAPVVWAGNGGAKGERHTTCPFRAGHFIGQWDHKFLLLHKNDALDRKRENLTYPSILYISDQHAVHERLRLEYFIVNAESYLELPSSSPTFFAVKIPDDICRDVTDYEVALQQWGWRFSYSTADRGTPRLCVAVRHWPNLVVEGHRLHLEGIGALRRTVEEFSVVSQTRGAPTDGAGVIPSAVLQFLITRSCRGALMFGDRLEERHAALLIDSLRAVSQYCVCSHGRPAFAAVQCLRPPRVQLPA
ncbi:unnamed protein product [Trypanosoma congolense IL3000]|uniref:WGS project CAEQ00000000 data, annotated contig 1164 n=1 Tax=Trypanosoma congolense (strain IL3000) TaxID=1068625 RepID=F9W4A9_TRYCI|nr:unnamed protein product [Trypanosoma congolense IL3000]